MIVRVVSVYLKICSKRSTSVHKKLFDDAMLVIVCICHLPTWKSLFNAQGLWNSVGSIQRGWSAFCRAQYHEEWMWKILRKSVVLKISQKLGSLAASVFKVLL